jgi:hypothetical protein
MIEKELYDRLIIIVICLNNKEKHGWMIAKTFRVLMQRVHDFLF